MLKRCLSLVSTAALLASLSLALGATSATATDDTYTWNGQNGLDALGSNACQDAQANDGNMLWIFNPGQGNTVTAATLYSADGTVARGAFTQESNGAWHDTTAFFDPTLPENQDVWVQFTGTLGKNPVLTISGCNEGGGGGGSSSTLTTEIHLNADDTAGTIVVGGSTAVDYHSTVHDSATLSGFTGPLPTGSFISFAFWDSIDCGVSENANAIDSSGGFDVSGDIDPTKVDPGLVEGPLGSGDYSFQAFFTSGDANAISDETSSCEPLSVNAQALGAPLTIGKDAAGGYKTTYKWTIGKAVDKTRVEQIGGTATFTYTVTVSHDGGTNSAVKVTGTITVTNPNPSSVDITSVTDKLSDTTSCSVTGGGAQTLGAGDTKFAYSCDLGNTVPTSDLFNTATVTWPDQDLGDGSHLIGDSANFTTPNAITFTSTLVDNCTTVTDPVLAGGTSSDNPFPANVCVGDPGDNAGTFTFTYHETFNVPAHDCKDYKNTASESTDGGSDSKTVTVCGPANSGALTMGFWQNKNGQGIISGQAKTGTCPSATWLRNFHPFSDLSATATCSQVATYVYNVIKAATCTSTTKTCNSMLKAQMLATALDVYFSDPALGGVKITAPDGPIGSIKIDLTKICSMVDGSGGTATCSGSFANVSTQFGGSTCLTVSQMLTYQNTSDPLADAGAVWYGQVKASQVSAKNAFDAINNQVAFSC